MPRLFGRFLGNTVSGAASFSVGAATAKTLDPYLQQLANDRWSDHAVVPLDPTLLADGVASGEVTLAVGIKEAAKSGISEDNFKRLVDVADTGPGTGQAFRLWRRNAIDDDAMQRALRRDGLEDEWITALLKTKDEPLSAEILANAIQQGFIPNDGILPTTTDTTLPIDIAAEQVNVDAIEEAGWSGVPSEHLKVLAFLSGNPPGPETLGDMLNRGIITEAAYEQGIREGRTKTKWIPALKEARFSILTGLQAINLWLRGWITEDEAKVHTRKAGYPDTLADLLFLGQGRPLSMRQSFIGHQRGGVYDGPTGQIPDYFLKALRQSSIRPEWYNLAWAQRHSLPSAFVIRGLTQSGDLTGAEAEGLLIDSGWPDDLAQKVSASWAGAGAGTGTSHTSKAQTQLWTRTHTSYLSGEATDAEALDKLASAGVPQAERAAVLKLWKEERELVRKQLSPSQVKKAWQKAVVHPATGQPWTRDDALAELLARGYNIDDANAFLDQ